VCVVALLPAAAIAQATSGTDSVAGSPPRESSTLRLLNERVPEVEFDSVSLESVMDWVAEITGANVVVRWQVLEDAGIERDRPITIKARNLRLSQVLWLVMNEAAGSDLKLAYRARGSLLVLSTDEDLGREMVLKVYDVGDLLASPTRFDNEATIDPAQVLSQQGSGGAGTVFQRGQGSEAGREEKQTKGIQDLVQLITKAVEPDTWAVNGAGGSGYVHAFGDVLVVYNSLRVHQRIGGCVDEGTFGP